LFLITIKQSIKNLNFANDKIAANARFRKDAIPIVLLQSAEIHNLIQVIKGRFFGDQGL